MKRVAVIDLGTNTFHILIAEQLNDGTIQDVYRERKFVKLAEEGIEKIGTASYQRGLNALIHFQKIIIEKNVSQVKAFGTAALRTASNGKTFIKDAKEKTGIQIELIPGSEEARLIHLGVIKAVQLGDEKGLIMDIGGGSVEFIIADKNEVFWARSFPIGVAVLYKNFHHDEPISTKEIQVLETYLDQLLVPLFSILKTHPTLCLIGASGTFDVLENILPLQQKSNLSTTIDVIHYAPLYDKVVQMNLKDRQDAQDIPDSRSDMIVVAMILIEYIIRKANIKKIMVSSYAMKEGILSEMLNSTTTN